MAVNSREVEWSDRVYGEASVAKLQRLDEERSELHKQIEELRDADEAPGGSSSELAD
jgi:hypothetical protein